MENLQKHLYVLILAGGGGTRLWPQSRENTPKQFINFFNNKSLYDLCIQRSLKITSANKVFIITNKKHRAAILAKSKAIPAQNIIFEPIRRDTALAHAVGAQYILKLDPQAVVIGLHSDNLIAPLEKFVTEAKYAAEIAFKTNKLVTIGIKPRFPHTGMGHIRIGAKIDGLRNTFKGDKFVEKPNIELAKKYTESGTFYWNSGMYVFVAKTFLELMAKHSPKTVAMFSKLENAIGTGSENQVLGSVYQMAPAISIDYALSEKLKSFICFVGDFHWTDVGDWTEVWKNLPQDSLGNVIEGPSGRGKFIGVNSKNNLFFLGKKLVATVGLENMVVVDTPDALLICPKDDAQGVKKIVELLKEHKLTDYL